MYTLQMIHIVETDIAETNTTLKTITLKKKKRPKLKTQQKPAY